MLLASLLMFLASLVFAEFPSDSVNPASVGIHDVPTVHAAAVIRHVDCVSAVSLLLQMSVFVGGPLVAFIPLLSAFLLLLSSLMLLAADDNAVAYIIAVTLRASCCWHSCYCWRPSSS
jgi:hypothetical protein